MSRTFAYKPYYMDPCPFKECGLPIRNGMKLKAPLYYKDFGLPDDLYKAIKTLTYDPEPYWCESD